jgi:SAM-dependent methyltransferase
MSDKKVHWETVFTTKEENEVSWYQKKPETSLDFFKHNAIPKDAKIIDIGGGDSYLIDHLLEIGYTNLYLLDISENAINRIKKRLGQEASQVTFIVSDILEYKPEIKFDVWHDRASFHFLTLSEDIETYRDIVTHSLNNKGYLFLGTFSENGPLKCSGLEIKQYDEAGMKEKFQQFDFKNLECQREDHVTPAGAVQNFVFCSFMKV